MAGPMRLKNGVSAISPCTATTPCRFSSIQIWSSLLASCVTCVAFCISILVFRVLSFELFLDFPRFSPVRFAVPFLHAPQFLVGLGRVFSFFRLALVLCHPLCFGDFFRHGLDVGFGKTLPAKVHAVRFARGVHTADFYVFYFLNLPRPQIGEKGGFGAVIAFPPQAGVISIASMPLGLTAPGG